MLPHEARGRTPRAAPRPLSPGLAGPSASLHTVNLQGNPVATSEAYKATLLHTLPNLRELDFRTVAR